MIISPCETERAGEGCWHICGVATKLSQIAFYEMHSLTGPNPQSEAFNGSVAVKLVSKHHYRDNWWDPCVSSDIKLNNHHFNELNIRFFSTLIIIKQHSNYFTAIPGVLCVSYRRSFSLVCVLQPELHVLAFFKRVF